jgi:hypothetical protein
MSRKHKDSTMSLSITTIILFALVCIATGCSDLQKIVALDPATDSPSPTSINDGSCNLPPRPSLSIPEDRGDAPPKYNDECAPFQIDPRSRYRCVSLETCQ